MFTTYQSKGFHGQDIVKTYIAYDAYGKTLKQYDVNSQGYTIRESIVQPEEFAAEYVTKAFSLHNQAFKQVLVFSKEVSSKEVEQ